MWYRVLNGTKNSGIYRDGTNITIQIEVVQNDSTDMSFNWYYCSSANSEYYKKKSIIKIYFIEKPKFMQLN